MSRSEQRRRQKRRAAVLKAGLFTLILAGLAFVIPVMGGKGSAGEDGRQAKTRAETEMCDGYTVIGIESIRVESELVPNRWETPTRQKDNTDEATVPGYYRDDVPLEYGLQDCLHLACQEFDVDYCVMLALIEKETAFQNIAGDSGQSKGYCQIQKKWWADLMDEIGAVDLTDPKDNFRTACAIIADHIEKYGKVEYALTAYNSGSPGTSQYATEVLEFAEKWRDAE